MSFNNRRKTDTIKSPGADNQDDGLHSYDEAESEVVENIPYLSPLRKRAREFAQKRGFIDEVHMEGWLYFNRLGNENYALDVDVLHSGANGNMLQSED